MNLSEILRNFRKIKGWTQKNISEFLGIPLTTWASYESGQANPPLKLLVKLRSEGLEIPGLTTSVAQDLKDAGAVADEKEMKLNALAKMLPPNTDGEVPSILLSKIEDGSIVPLVANEKEFTLFKFAHGKTMPVSALAEDTDAMALLPVYGQRAAAGQGQFETQLSQIESYIPFLIELLGGADPRNCGMVRVVGDSMVDINLFNGDLVVFDRTLLEGDGVYVISIGTDVRVKHLEYRAIERKIVISSENAKRYPNPEIITYEQAENLFRIHGKVISWVHHHPY